MNKTKVYLLSAIGVTVLAMLVTFFVLRPSGDTYANALPSDATAIARLNIKSFLNAASLGTKDLLRLMHHSRKAQANGETKSLGIDLKRPLYAFSSASGYFGILAAVDKADGLAAYLEEEHATGRASEVIRQRGYSWAVVTQQWLLAYDDERVLMMGPAVGAAQDQLRTEMVGLLEQGSHDSGLQSSLYQELKKSDKPLEAVLAPELLPAIPRGFLRRFNIASMDDALLRLTMEMNRHELVVDANVIAKSENVKKQLSRINEQLRPIKGSLVDNTHTENVAWMTMNVKGDVFLETLRSNPTVRTTLLALNFAFDLDRIIRSVDGDLALEVTGAALPVNASVLDFQFRDFYVTAKVANTDFLSGAASWGNRLIGIKALTSQDFALSLGNSQVYFGVEDKTFYLSGERGLTTEGNAYLRGKRGDIKGDRFYATIAMPQLLRQLGEEAEMPEALRQFERLTVEMKEAGKLKLTLKAPEGMNIVKQLLLGE